MSAIKQCCSLCCTSCTAYKLLQNEFGESNKYYEITVKYFDPMLLSDEGYTSAQNVQLLCQECWLHIQDFHEFQQTVLKTRMLWENNEHIKSLHTEVKLEDDLTNYETNAILNKTEFDKTENEPDLLDDFEIQDVKTESVTSFEDTVGSIHKQPYEKERERKRGNLRLEEDENKHEIGSQTKTRSRKYKIVNNKTIKPHDHDDAVAGNSKRKKPKLSEGIKEKAISAFNLDKARESDAFIAEWKPELVCDLCSETANNFDKLRSHFKEKHKTRFYIKCCERKFFRRCVLVNHIQLHLNPETHKCDICGKSSTTKHNLKLHKKVMHEDTKQLKCDICEKLFKQKVTLDRHLLTHATGSKDFVCSECGKGYVAEQLLKLHIKHVHNVDRVCDQCGKTIHGFQALKKHLMEHAGIERPKFPCDVCGLELKSPNGLKRHKAAYHNDGTTIYVCGVCGKVAASENALWNHKKLVHVEERKHKCTYCEKAFKRPKSLREHIATHTGQDLYQCPHCPQTFKVSANMHHHRKKVHPVEWEEGRKNRLQHPKININQVKKQVVI